MNERKRHSCLTLLLFLFATTLFAQTTEEKERIRQQRLRTIDLFHLSTGMDVHANQNVFFSPKFSIGIGSFRNLFNADLGVRYTLGGSMFSGQSESIMTHQIPVFLSAQCNMVSWKTNCVFIGAEIAYHIPITAFHFLPSTFRFDSNLNSAHFSGRAKIGARIDQWETSLFYEYDLAPSMKQKYVYESNEYNYDVLHNTLFERMRYGVSVSYIFNL